MMLIPCPWCGLRDESEFASRGAVTGRPPVATAADSEWRDYLYSAPNDRGWLREFWSHSFGCRQLFIIRRHTVTHAIRADSETTDD